MMGGDATEEEAMKERRRTARHGRSQVQPPTNEKEHLKFFASAESSRGKM